MPSDIRSLVWMLTQIPAGQPSLVRKQRTHAGLRLRWIEDELGLPILLQNGIVMIHRYRAVGVPIGRGADSEDCIVEAKGKSCRRGNAQNYGKKDSPQSNFEVGGRCRRHAGRL